MENQYVIKHTVIYPESRKEHISYFEKRDWALTFTDLNHCHKYTNKTEAIKMLDWLKRYYKNSNQKDFELIKL